MVSAAMQRTIDIATRDFLLRAHYHLMDNPRFWYEKGLMEASRLFCTRASDLNIEILKGN